MSKPSTDTKNQQFKYKKSLGQHFLQHHPTAQKIVDSLSFSQSYNNIIEIGPGNGMLTQYLTQKNTTHKIFLIEKDPTLIQKLKDKYHQTHVLQNDYLTTSLEQITDNKPLALIGNLPYNISSSILFKSLHNTQIVQEMIFMLQKEVAQRISSKHNTKTYGILSVLLQTFYTVEYLFTVPPQLFKPIPKVHSAIVRLKNKNIKQLQCNKHTLIKIVKLAFQQRRKKIKNSLKILKLPLSIISNFHQKRPEQLKYQDFITLTHNIEQYQNNIK